MRPSPLIFLSTRAAVETKNESKVCTLFSDAQAISWICPRSMPISRYPKWLLISSSVKVYWVSIVGWNLVCSVSLSPMGRWFLFSLENYPDTQDWSVYYYFYERARDAILRSREGSKALSTVESILTGLIAGACILYGLSRAHKVYPFSGSATTVISNPIWVVQTSQAVHTMSPDSNEKATIMRLSFFETLKNLLAKEGLR